MTQTDALRTEQIDSRFADLDLLDGRNLLERLLNDQETAVSAVRASLADLTRAALAASEHLGQGGRLVYVGAGTSGRLGMIDAAELPPTFSWPPERTVNLVAGGRDAFFAAVENAEDDRMAAERDFREAGVGALDVMIGVAASGTTPYVVRALELARTGGALTVGVANNPDTPVLRLAEYPVLLNTGPEVISGSTRLKAGTAQKIALNLFSTSVMVRLGKVYQNLMVDLVATNDKLVGRAARLLEQTTGLEPAQTAGYLRDAGGNVKTAIVSARVGVTAAEARTRLAAHGGHLRAVLGHGSLPVPPRSLPAGVIVSCQARADNPLHGPQFMRAMALAVQQAGAVALRANGPSDIRAIRDASDLPIIGIQKIYSRSAVYITPDFDAARLVARAGADIIALDATSRPRPVPLGDLIRFVHEELGKLVMADVSTLAEGRAAAEHGADYVASTLSGYVGGAPPPPGPDVALVRALSIHLAVPVIAEGRLGGPEDVAAVREAGAHAAVIGTAITNPREIARRFVRAWSG